MFTCRGEDLCYLVAPRPLSSIFQVSTDWSFTPLLCSSILLDGRRVGVALNATIITRAFFSIDTETDSFSENRYNSGLKRWFRTIESPLFILPSFFLIFFFFILSFRSRYKNKSAPFGDDFVDRRKWISPTQLLHFVARFPFSFYLYYIHIRTCIRTFRRRVDL